MSQQPIRTIHISSRDHPDLENTFVYVTVWREGKESQRRYSDISLASIRRAQRAQMAVLSRRQLFRKFRPQPRYVTSQPCPDCGSRKVVDTGRGPSGDYNTPGGMQGLDLSELKCENCNFSWLW